METSMGPGNMSFGSFKSTLGTLLIAVILNTFLYGIVVFQYASYYTARFRDPRWIQWSLSGLFITDTVHSMSIVYLIWLYLIEGFNNPRSNLDIHWPLPLSILVGGSTAFAVQLFLCYRVFLLSKLKIIVGFLAFLSTGLFSVAIFGTVRVFMMENQLERGPIDDILLTIWKPLEAFLNLVLAGLLLFAMRSAAGTSQSDRIFKRLARMSIQTGLCSAVFALMVMTLWLAKPKTNFFLIFSLPISRVYTSTLLDTLISRPKLRAMMSSKATNGMSRGTEIYNLSQARPDSQFQGRQSDITSEIKFPSALIGPERLSSTRGNMPTMNLELPSPKNKSAAPQWATSEPPFTHPYNQAAAR